MKSIGHRLWAIAGGHIPLESTGHEPEFTSRETLCVLNTAAQDAAVSLTIYYADREPVGPYQIRIGARRVRHVRLNDLIDPEAMPLDTDYGCVIESDVPVVIQFLRQDTRQAENALLSILPYAAD